MKYKDKDGNVYDGDMQAIEAWCPCSGPLDVEHCRNCSLSIAGGDLTCVEYTADYPREAARIMGYEVIENGEDTNVPAKNDDNQPHICKQCVWEDTGECADCKNNGKFKLCNPADCDETPESCINWGMADCAVCMDKSNFEPVSNADKVEDKPMEETKGLYRKYMVTKADTGEEVTDCFVLRPAQDLAAVAALKEYCRVTLNPDLANDIMQWLVEIVNPTVGLFVGMNNQPVTRASILESARKCVCGDREQDYGSPENNFQTIANLWMDYLQGRGYTPDIEPKDVACMMALLKIARIASGHAKADNWIDLAGYAACGGEIEAKEGKA